jgi:hypothetical protein
MRAAFGLVSLLICLGIIILIMKMGGHPADVIEHSKSARGQAERIAGVDHEGMRVQDSIRLDAVEKNSKIAYMLVDDIVADGPMANYFGLKRNDQILTVGPLDLRDQDAGMAKALILEARTRQQELTVRRDGEIIKLPNAAGPSKQAGQNDTGTPLSRQLEGIKGATKIPTH